MIIKVIEICYNKIILWKNETIKIHITNKIIAYEISMLSKLIINIEYGVLFLEEVYFYYILS